MRTHQPANIARNAVRWIPAVAWMALIFWLSSLTATGLPSGLSSPAHFTAYAVLAALYAAAFTRAVPADRVVAIAVLLSSAYGATDEFHQSFVPGRVPDVADWGFDTLGALVGAIAMVALLRLLAEHAGGSSATG